MLAITAANATQPSVAGMSKRADPARNPHMVSGCQPVAGNSAYVRTAWRNRVTGQPRGRATPRDGHEWRSWRMTTATASAAAQATTWVL
jgi:hypothetical protein